MKTKKKKKRKKTYNRTKNCFVVILPHHKNVKLVSDPFVVIMNNKISLNQQFTKLT
jgi:hypothetical protein